MRKLKHVEIVRPTSDELARLPRHPISVLIDDIRSAHNVGSILRSADAIRAEHVYLCGLSPDASHRGVNKSALGAQDAVPWSHVDRAAEAADLLKGRGVTLIALEHTDSPTPLERLTAKSFPACLMLGNEVDGLSEALLERADVAIELAQFGVKQSLNVSVAAGIALYDLLRLYLGTAQSSVDANL